MGMANDDVRATVLAARGDLVADVPWWSPSQLAGRYGVSRQTRDQWIGSGRLPRPTQHPSGMGYFWHERDLPAPAKGAASVTVSDDDELEEAF